jgi:EmrB/QacA subfamily drug resistance transporter
MPIRPFTPPAASEKPHKYLVMAAVASGVFLATIDGSIVNIALPTLESDLHTHFAIVQWVVLAYLLTATTLLLSIGRLADIYGKKALYLVGFALFTIGSFLCGISSTVYMLIAFRILQAIGAAMTMALGTAIVTEVFPPEELGKALGLTGLMVSIGAISGPTVGGLILSSFSWHWIFFVNLPIGVIGIILVARFVPRTIPGAHESFDFAGAGVLFLSMLSFLMSLTLAQELGFASPFVIALFTSAAIFMMLFIRIERTAKSPMIDFGMFSNDLFSINLITGFLTFVCSAGIVLLMPFYLQGVLKFSPGTSGLLLATVPLSMGITSPISGSLSDRFGSRILTVIGLAVLLAGYIGLTSLSIHTTPLVYFLHFLPIGFGMGFFQSPNNSAVMGAVPKNRLGVASGLLSLTRTIGQTTGIAILGTIWSSWVQRLSNTPVGGDATAAAPALQVMSLHNTIFVIIALITLALVMSLWALLQEKQREFAASN